LDVIPFLIDASDIANHNMQFYSQLTLFAKDVMAIFDKLVWELARRHMGTEDPPVFRVQVHNLLDRSHRSMRDINDSDVDTLITIKGIVIRCSELIPDMQYAFKEIVQLCVICDGLFSLHFLCFLQCCLVVTGMHGFDATPTVATVRLSASSKKAYLHL
jgi:DNA replicative helicase MCM subunit Mcm2 (Cdc46/Mcm family)